MFHLDPFRSLFCRRQSTDEWHLWTSSTADVVQILRLLARTIRGYLVQPLAAIARDVEHIELADGSEMNATLTLTELHHDEQLGH